MSANLTWLAGQEFVNQNIEIANELNHAMQELKPTIDKWKIISQWRVDSKVKNTFYDGYCTYWAALISPEFFPYISETEQKRSRWGNAAQRCENSSKAWFKIGNTPMKWALIVYKEWFRYISAGHVGKVMDYKPDIWKIIVRDMNRVGKFMMSDRREKTDNTNIKCYIYPPNRATPKPKPIVAGDIDIKDNPIITPKPEPVITPEPIITPEPVITEPKPIITPPKPIITPPEPKLPSNQVTKLLSGIDLDFSNITNEAIKHFISQRNINISTDDQTWVLNTNDEFIITLKITKKNTQDYFMWIIPVPLNIVPINKNIDLDYSSIQFINNKKTEITITAKKTWTTTLLINRGYIKIWKIKLNIQ